MVSVINLTDNFAHKTLVYFSYLPLPNSIFFFLVLIFVVHLIFNDFD